MQQLVEYLSNPIKTGVWRAQVSLDLSDLFDLYEYISKLLDKAGSKFITNIYEEGIKEGDNSVFDLLLVAISILRNYDKLPEKTMTYISLKSDNLEKDTHERSTSVHFYAKKVDSKLVSSVFGDVWYSMQMRLDTDDKINYSIHDGKMENLFSSKMTADSSEVLLITKRFTNNKLIFTLLSLKKSSIDLFNNFLQSIPVINDNIVINQIHQSFSTRYIFKPFPSAIRLWINNPTIIQVPEDLMDFIEGAISYYEKYEWRTSIVLSSITVESILADLYEEIKKDYAPNKPLGTIYYEIKDNIPEEVQKAIEIVNESRISAVHRSRHPVSIREATNALVGATNLTLWYASNY